VRSLLRHQSLIRLNLTQPFKSVPRPAQAPLVLLRSAAQAEQNCAEIAQARYMREQREERLKNLVETERMEQQWVRPFQERRF
jgi:hypothetical protein